MKVADIMTRGVKTCSPSDTLHTAAKIMWQDDCGCVPVVDRAAKLVGILTDRDVCMATYTQGLALHDLTVASAMAPTVITCGPEDDIAEAARLMGQNKVRRLPVLEDSQHLAGIVSMSDIAREAEQERKSGQRRHIEAAEIADSLGRICQPRGHTEAHLTFAPERGEIEFPPTPPPKRGHLHKPHARIKT